MCCGREIVTNRIRGVGYCKANVECEGGCVCNVGGGNDEYECVDDILEGSRWKENGFVNKDGGVVGKPGVECEKSSSDDLLFSLIDSEFVSPIYLNMSSMVGSSIW